MGELLGLQLAYNPGAAFSFGANSTWIFTIISAVAVAAAGPVLLEADRQQRAVVARDARVVLHQHPHQA
ncbi:hypothetical protein [Micrococcus luteus]|uniref:hypothetical protein n=1 Tax=Micrococcus luteus TaxID=1270 RepID=UPI003F73C1DB